MRVTVTQEDIDKGNPAVHDSCPVALAVARATGKEASVLYEWMGKPSRGYPYPRR